MRRVLGILAIVGVTVIAGGTPAVADYGSPPIWCGITTTGLPGGTVNHRVAIKGFWTDPQTNITGYLVSGVETTLGTDVWGYGHTSPGPSFPITISFTSGPTLGTPLVRQYRYDIQSNLTGTTRITDINTNGTFTAIANFGISCQF